MSDLIIKKSDVENLGRKLMKKVYKFLHDKYILSFEEMKVEKDKIEKYLIQFYFKKDKIENYFHVFDFNFFDKSEDKIEDEKYLKEIEDKIEDEKYLKEIEDKIEDESLDIDLIFKVLDKIELEMEIDEDLFCKKKAFSYIYLVFDHYYKYLED